MRTKQLIVFSLVTGIIRSEMVRGRIFQIENIWRAVRLRLMKSKPQFAKQYLTAATSGGNHQIQRISKSDIHHTKKFIRHTTSEYGFSGSFVAGRGDRLITGSRTRRFLLGHPVPNRWTNCDWHRPDGTNRWTNCDWHCRYRPQVEKADGR